MPEYRNKPSEYILTDVEVSKMYDLCEKEAARVYLSLQWRSGARPEEIRILRRKDISWTGDRLTITLKTLKLKNVKSGFFLPFRTLVFARPPMARMDRYIETIIKWCETLRPEDKVIDYSKKWMERLLNDTGFKITKQYITPYHLRHWSFTWMAVYDKMTMPELKYVKGAAGIKSVECYIEAVPKLIGMEKPIGRANTYVDMKATGGMNEQT